MTFHRNISRQGWKTPPIEFEAAPVGLENPGSKDATLTLPDRRDFSVPPNP